MSNSTDSYDHRAYLRVKHTEVITAEEKALLHVEVQVNKLHRLDYMEDSLIGIQESIKELWNEIRQAAQADTGANRVYLKWLEKRVKAKRDDEEEQLRRLSSESEKEGEDEEEEDDDKEAIEDLHDTKSESAREQISDSSITASYFGQKQITKVLEKRPARPGR